MRLVFLGPDDVTPLKMGVETEVLDLIELDPEGGHWFWRGNLTPFKKGADGGDRSSGGYGRTNIRAAVARAAQVGLCSKSSGGVLVHRYIYWCWSGQVPTDECGQKLVLDHDVDLCSGRQHHCCNPQHLTPVIHRLNTARGVHARRHIERGQIPLLSSTQYEEGVHRPDV